MSEESETPDPDDLERLGLYDPMAPDAAERLELIRYALTAGATVADVVAASNLGELALDMTLRPRGSLTLGEVVETTSTPWPLAQRLLTAVGLSTNPDLLITADEAATVRLLATASSDLLGEEAAIQLARVAGNAMARIAETVVGVFRLQVELPRRDTGIPDVDVVKEYVDLAETLLPLFVRTLDAVLRRQIVAVTDRMWSIDDERSAVTMLRTVGFVDLVGYTSASASMSVRELTAVLVEFDERTAEVVARGHGQIVKTIGDEAMFVTEDAADACRIALDLVDGSGGQLPPVRVGLATGEVISVFGDLYGPDVNLAARLVAVADPATAVVSERVRTSAGEFQFEALPPLALKGFATETSAYRVRG